MKIREIIFTTALSALVCFGLCQQVQSATDTPDPGGSLPTSNTADGQGALGSLTTGLYNSAFGFLSVLSLSDGNFDTGVGAGALLVDNGGKNTAVGAGALFSNTDAGNNTAVGTFAMFTNSHGISNTAVGDESLEFNVIAFTNAALGTFALQNNDSSGSGAANFNTAVGGFALQANIDGTRNTAVGAGALEGANGGSDNTAIGEIAGSNLTGGSGNIYIGSGVAAGAGNEVRFIRIGDTGFTDFDCFIAGIFGRTIDAGTAVIVGIDANQKLGTVAVDMNGHKVPFQPQAMVNESLKQQKRIAELEGMVTRLASTVKDQAAQIQKVSAQLEVNKPAPRVVVNKP